jgi:acetolactate synthase-1/2/3 large subunit
MIRQAFRMATSGRPGPTHVLIPEDIISQKGDEASVDIWPPEKYRVTATAPADPALIRQAAEMLVNAELVNIHCGNGAERAGASKEVLQLAEYLGCPITSTIRARGIIPDTHALSFHPTCMSRIVANAQADLVLAVGTRLGELNMWGKPPMFGEPGKQKLIQIDTEPTHIGLNKPTDIPLIGDAKCILSQLTEAVKTLTDKRPPHEKIAALRIHRKNPC